MKIIFLLILFGKQANKFNADYLILYDLFYLFFSKNKWLRTAKNIVDKVRVFLEKSIFSFLKKS